MKKTVEFGDYLFLGCNVLPEDMQVGFLDYFKYLLDTNFNDLEKSLRLGLEFKSFPKRNDQQIIEGILATTLKDSGKKRKDKNYYHCNAVCLMKVVRSIYNIDLYNVLNNEKTPQIALHNYEHILKWILIDAQELCNLYSNILKNDLKYKSSIDTRYINYMSVHQVLRQSLFGQVSANSFADMEISAAIAVIRQLIEFRIRRAFGTLSYIDQEGNLLPLELSLVFECLKKHKEDIVFPISLENIERIYKWSNLYIHSGKSDLSWIPYFIEDILKTFSFGQIKDNGWEVKNAITTYETIIKQLHGELIERAKKPNLNIYTCPPECALK